MCAFLMIRRNKKFYWGNVKTKTATCHSPGTAGKQKVNKHRWVWVKHCEENQTECRSKGERRTPGGGVAKEGPSEERHRTV